jgi:putative FmdB family regulatory protein
MTTETRSSKVVSRFFKGYRPMPLYEYECEQCAHRFERIRRFSDPPLETCPKCGGPVRKLMSSPAIQFKGSGWYITDYARKDSAAPGKDDKGEKSEKGETASGSPGTNGGKSDASTETKAESAAESKSESKADTKKPSKSEAASTTK